LKKIITVIAVLFLVIISSIRVNVQPVRSDYVWTETIYIKADGSVYPNNTCISSANNVTYDLTDNIIDAAPSNGSIAIVVERNNIVLDGHGYTLQANYSPSLRTFENEGIDLTERNNVTIKNTVIRQFYYSLLINRSSSLNTVSGNTMTNNGIGVKVKYSFNNTISGNNLTNNDCCGVRLWGSWYNIVSENNSTNNHVSGVGVGDNSTYNIVFDNKLVNNANGIALNDSSYNIVYHNGFEGSTHNQTLIVHQLIVPPGYYPNSLNNSYSIGGNYWSDYTGVDKKSGPYQNETGSDGIGDTPYIVDADNIDWYPLMCSGPDLRVGTDDVNFNPASPVRLSTNVNITANIHNYGTCYVVLNESGLVSNPADKVKYDFSRNATVSTKIRIRASAQGEFNPTNRSELSAIISNQSRVFDINETDWDTYESDAQIATVGNHTLEVYFVIGGSYSDVWIDWIEIVRTNDGAVLHHFEAEEYVADKSSVDAIHPSGVTVQFFQGHPDNGTQIGGNQTVGNAQNTIKTGTVWYVTSGGNATASVPWTASPPGSVDIYVRVLPDPHEQSLISNMAYKTIGVLATVGGIVVPVDKFGLLAPYLGLASTVLLATVATAVYAKRAKRRRAKQ
jgi:parallel beta-helix repeat protein